MTADIEHISVRANGINFHVAAAGPRDAPSVLLLHGFPEGWMSWRTVMGALQHDARVYAPDLRGYPGSDRPLGGYDVFTLTDDIKALIEELKLDHPVIVGHDWGGEVLWIFGHRYSHLMRRMIVVNGTHPRTLLRAVLRFDDFQGLRLPWLAIFEIPWLPEFVLTTRVGRRILRLSFTLREGVKGTMDRNLVRELAARFQRPADMRGPINYYREFAKTILFPNRRARLNEIYKTPIDVPVTLVWGEKDEALSGKVARKSGRDAGCEVEWRGLPGVGHFVDLEAPETLAAEIRRAMAAAS